MQLESFLTMRGGAGLTAAELRAWLGLTLPVNMIPARFAVLAAGAGGSGR